MNSLRKTKLDVKTLLKKQTTPLQCSSEADQSAVNFVQRLENKMLRAIWSTTNAKIHEHLNIETVKE